MHIFVDNKYISMFVKLSHGCGSCELFTRVSKHQAVITTLPPPYAEIHTSLISD